MLTIFLALFFSVAVANIQQEDLAIVKFRSTENENSAVQNTWLTIPKIKTDGLNSDAEIIINSRAKRDSTSETMVSKVPLPADAIAKFRAQQAKIQNTFNLNNQKTTNQNGNSVDKMSSADSSSTTTNNNNDQVVDQVMDSALFPAVAAQSSFSMMLKSADNSNDFKETVELPPLKSNSNGKSNFQTVLVQGDNANATFSRTANSMSIEAHNIL